MPVIDILLKLESFINFILMPFSSCKGENEHPIGRRFHTWYEDMFDTVFNLNALELDNFEKQKKQTQLIFEDLIMLFLDGLIFT